MPHLTFSHNLNAHLTIVIQFLRYIIQLSSIPESYAKIKLVFNSRFSKAFCARINEPLISLSTGVLITSSNQGKNMSLVK